MTFEKPRMEFVAINLDSEVTAASPCVSEAQRAGLETCDCTDGYKDGATGADEEYCDPGAFEFWE